MGDAYRNGRIHVLSERCSTCVFRPGNKMHLAPGRFKDMVEANRKNDTAFACHQTLDYNHEYDAPGNAVCRGYFDAFKEEITPLRMAVAMDLIVEQEPPARRSSTTSGKPH